MPSVPAAETAAEERWDLVASLSCPGCGSFLDAPRIDPLSGRLARKCLACREWHPVTRRFAQSRAPEQG